jgi:hypothetical protein
MSTETLCNGSVYTTVAPSTPIQLFPASIERVFNRLECIEKDDELYEPGEPRPSTATILWAKLVLLRVLPSYYLRTAEIDVFRGEIHVSWERGGKRVVVFLPSPKAIKLYAEWTKENGDTEHSMRSVEEPREISNILKWLFS